MKINLPSFILAGLYRNTLVINPAPGTIEKPIKEMPEKPTVPLKTSEETTYLGQNKKNLLILVQTVDATFINDESLATLTKILEALKMNLADVAILNYYPHPKTFQEIKETLKPKCILLFDVSLKQLQLPFTIPHYQIQQYDNCTFMTAPALTLSSATTDAVKKEKKLLWENLKKIFTA